jgi:hypothetical protein
MPKIYERLDSKKAKDIRILGNFISVFCREKHRAEAKDTFPMRDAKLWQSLGEKDLILCQECCKLLNHGIAKLLLCPYDPKPMCKKCETHCYAPGCRERIREVMKFSGRYLIRHGRIDLMLHYLL